MEMERIICGGHDVTDDVLKRLRDMKALRVLQATKQIALAAKAGGERRILRNANGSAAGAVSMQIHRESYHYWGQRLGYSCWADKQFCAEYLRDNPAARIKTVTERPTIAVGWEGNKRSSESYKLAA